MLFNWSDKHLVIYTPMNYNTHIPTKEVLVWTFVNEDQFVNRNLSFSRIILSFVD